MSLSVLRHVELSTEERVAFLKLTAAKRRGEGEEEEIPSESPSEAEEQVAEVALAPDRVAAWEAAEEFLLTVTDGGFGKRSSAYEYRVTNRGGQGFANITLSRRTGSAVVATLPVRPGDDVMLMTDAGRLIRVPADQVRITGRTAMGVTLFRLDAEEHVTAVFPVLEAVADDDDPDDSSAPDVESSDNG